MKTIAEQFPHYFKDVSNLEVLDIYRVLQLWEVTDNALGHAIKKLLVSGRRGAKNQQEDVKEAGVAIQRWLEMRAEDERRVTAATPATIPVPFPDTRTPERKLSDYLYGKNQTQESELHHQSV